VILTVLQLTRWIDYNKHRILHHINKVALRKGEIKRLEAMKLWIWRLIEDKLD